MATTRKPYLLTHHLRDVDRYLRRRDGPRVYGLLRRNRPYASVTVFAGGRPWSEDARRRIKVLMQEVSVPWRSRGHWLPPRSEVGANYARAEHVDILWVEWLCQELATIREDKLMGAER